MEEGNLEPEELSGADNLPVAPAARQSASMPAVASSQALSPDLRVPESAGTDEDGIDLMSYWRIMVKRKWTVIGALVFVLSATVIGTLLVTPIYRAAASLRIDRDTIEIVQVGAVSAAKGPGESDFYQTQYELLKSRALAEKVVNQLGIKDLSGIPRSSRPTVWSKLKSLLNPESKKAPTASSTDKRDIVAAFRGGLVVAPVGNSALVEVMYDSPDPDFAARAANALAEGFTASNLEHGFESSAYAKSYLEDRLQELKVKLEDSERALVKFAQKEQILSAGGAGGGTLTEQNLGSVNADLSKARSERIRAQSRWQQAEGSSGMGLPADMLENSGIRKLQEARSRLLAEYQDKLRLFKPAYPTMLQLKGQIDEMDKQIAIEASNIKSSIRAEYQAALSQEKMLQSELDGMKVDVLDLQGRSIQYNIAKREVDTNRQLYDGLLQRYKEIGVAGGVTTNNISIVDRADGAYKLKPDMQKNLIMGLLLGTILGVLLALLFEYLDDTVKSPEEIEKLLGLSVLGVIPKLKSPLSPASAFEDPRSGFSEAYRSVRTALQFATDRGVPKSLLITSATPGEGKSTTALTLAKNFAQLGKRVLLIDADLRNPSLHRQLGLENSSGLSNFLAGAIKATDVLQPTVFPHLVFMASGPLPPNPAELLVGRKLISLLTVAMEKFDQVIVDGPPVMGLADAAILGNICGGTVLVVEAGETRVAVARNSLKRLLAARARIAGAILTKFAAGRGAHGYGYGYGDYSYYEYGGKTKPKLSQQ